MATSKLNAIRLIRDADRVVSRVRMTTSRHWFIEVTKTAALMAVAEQYNSARLCVYKDKYVVGLLVMGAKEI